MLSPCLIKLSKCILFVIYSNVLPFFHRPVISVFTLVKSVNNYIYSAVA